MNRTIETLTKADEDASSDIVVGPCAASSTPARKHPQAIISGGTMMDNRALFGRRIDPHQVRVRLPSPAEGPIDGAAPERHSTMRNGLHCCERRSSLEHEAIRRTRRRVRLGSQRARVAGIACIMRID